MNIEEAMNNREKLDAIRAALFEECHGNGITSRTAADVYLDTLVTIIIDQEERLLELERRSDAEIDYQSRTVGANVSDKLYQALGSGAEQVNSGTPSATVYRYMVRREEGHGDWAVVYIESSGRLLIHSDYGAFGYRWDAIGDEDPREWFADLFEREAKSQNNYVIAKLAAGRRDWFDANKAADWLASKGVDEEGVSLVRDQDDNETAQRCYYTMACGVPAAPPSFTGPPRGLEALRDSIFPRLAKLIREHLAAEAKGG